MIKTVQHGASLSSLDRAQLADISVIVRVSLILEGCIKSLMQFMLHQMSLGRSLDSLPSRRHHRFLNTEPHRRLNLCSRPRVRLLFTPLP